MLKEVKCSYYDWIDDASGNQSYWHTSVAMYMLRPINYPLFLFYSHIVSYLLFLFVLLFCVLTPRETCMDLTHNFVVAIVYISVSN